MFLQHTKQQGCGVPPKEPLDGAIDIHFGSLEGLMRKITAQDAAQDAALQGL